MRARQAKKIINNLYKRSFMIALAIAYDDFK